MEKSYKNLAAAGKKLKTPYEIGRFKLGRTAFAGMDGLDASWR